MTIDRKDMGAGAFFLGVAAVYGYYTWQYLPIGQALSMGPGYFPFVLCLLIAAVGLFLVARSLKSGAAGGGSSVIAWRALLMISAGVVLFGSFLREAGLVLAVFVTVMLAFYAGRGTRPREALAFALGLAGFTALVFGFGLRLPIPLIGTWFIR